MPEPPKDFRSHYVKTGMYETDRRLARKNKVFRPDIPLPGSMKPKKIKRVKKKS